MASRTVAAAIALILLAATAGAAEAPPPGTGTVVLTAEVTAPPKVLPPHSPKLTAAERCASLEQQFTAAALLHLTSKKLAGARKLADEGSEDCGVKKYSLGTRRLAAALAALGVAPKL
jgi:hypothetical protein